MTANRAIRVTAAPTPPSTREKAPAEPNAVSTTPWPAQVNGAALLDELTATIRNYVVLETNAAEAAALWVLHTHAIDAFSITPRLGVTSALPRCGKTTFLDVLYGLVRAPMLSGNLSAASIYRQIDAHEPTLLLDEADTYLPGNQAMRGILNFGHRRNSAYVFRGNDKFSTWAPVAIAMIGRLPATLEDRCIPVRLQRRRADEVIAPFRHDKTQDLILLYRMSVRWAADNLSILSSADPAVPDELQNRAADNWRPLLAVADAAGGKWPKLARQVAATIERSKQATDQDPAVMLLEDIYAVTQQSNANLTSERLVSALIRIDDRPWADWKGGAPITKKAVANLLAPFKIAPVEMRVGSQVLRGYRVSQFEDAFARYVSAAAPRSAGAVKAAKAKPSRLVAV